MAVAASAQELRLSEDQLTTYSANNGKVKLITHPNGATVPEEPEWNRAVRASLIDALALGQLNEIDPVAAQQAITASEQNPLPYLSLTNTLAYERAPNAGAVPIPGVAPLGYPTVRGVPAPFPGYFY